MAKTLIEDALGDPRNADALAAAADISYYAEPRHGRNSARTGAERPPDQRRQHPSVHRHQRRAPGRRLPGHRDPTSLDGFKDWLLTDAVNLLIVPEGRLGTDLAAAGVGARFHQGFVNAIGEIWDAVYAAVDQELKAAERPLWITGHSLGGALALLAGWLFSATDDLRASNLYLRCTDDRQRQSHPGHRPGVRRQDLPLRESAGPGAETADDEPGGEPVLRTARRRSRWAQPGPWGPPPISFTSLPSRRWMAF